MKTPNPIDRHVGARVRMRRMMRKITQEKLGDALGVAFQQVQKYEKGTNRISASRLQKIASVLQVPVGFFFDGQADAPQIAEDRSTTQTQAVIDEFISTRDGIELVKAFANIKDSRVRRALVRLATLIASKGR